MSYKEHKKSANKILNVVIITVSDTRNFDTDESGKLIKKKLEQNNHNIIDYKICKDEPSDIISIIKSYSNIDAVILNGGTGISRRDTTYEAIEKLVHKKIHGFGEIFRYLSYHEIGSSAILSRAFAGVYNDIIILSIPGSKKACKLAMDKLIIKELPHMVFEIKK